MKETEQTLFLKSNLLHIRLKEGEFEVVDYRCAKLKELPCAGEGIEWPYGVELIKMCASDVCDTDGACEYCREPKTLARLLPEEKKSESAYKEGEECPRVDCNCRHGICLRAVIEACEPENNEPVSAPSESQEEMWKKHCEQEALWDSAMQIGNSEKTYKAAIHKIMKYFSITRKPE